MAIKQNRSKCCWLCVGPLAVLSFVTIIYVLLEGQIPREIYHGKIIRDTIFTAIDSFGILNSNITNNRVKNTVLINETMYIIDKKISHGQTGVIYAAKKVNNNSSDNQYVLKKSHGYQCNQLRAEYKLLMEVSKNDSVFPSVYGYTENNDTQPTECMLVKDLIANATQVKYLAKDKNVCKHSMDHIILSFLNCYKNIISKLSIFHKHNIYSKDINFENILYQYDTTKNQSLCHLIDFNFNIILKNGINNTNNYYNAPIEFFSVYAWYILLNESKRNKYTYDKLNYFAIKDNIYNVAVLIMDRFVKCLIVGKRNKYIKLSELRRSFLKIYRITYKMDINGVRGKIGKQSTYLPPKRFTNIWRERVTMVENIYLMLNNTKVDFNNQYAFRHILLPIVENYNWSEKQK
eukprot:513535_1